MKVLGTIIGCGLFVALLAFIGYEIFAIIRDFKRRREKKRKDKSEREVKKE